MINQLQIVHSSNGDQKDIPPGFTEWKTCLRSIFFGDENLKTTHSGVDAYEFILQVICGLHSPMIGETEILAQFKKFLETNPDVITHKISHKLIQDAKTLRTKYLKSYGSQSYGSYTLKESKGFDSIVLLGAGSLVQEIVPIIKDFSGKIIIRTRSPEKALPIQKKYPQVNIENEKREYSNSLIVIAAPIPSNVLENLIDNQFKDSSVLDMRSIQDGPALALKYHPKYKTLTEIFSEIEATQKVLQLTAKKMKDEIKELSHRWHKQAQVRPFGWEDLCC